MPPKQTGKTRTGQPRRGAGSGKNPAQKVVRQVSKYQTAGEGRGVVKNLKAGGTIYKQNKQIRHVMQQARREKASGGNVNLRALQKAMVKLKKMY